MEKGETMDKEMALAVIVTLLAVVLYIFMAMRVGVMRGVHKIPAPAMLGHPQFERASRVHLNTGEQMVSFVPLLWMATLTFHAPYWLPAVFGLWFVLARALYMRLYVSAPESRTPGAFLTILPQLGLLVLTVIGLAQAWPAIWA
jgi:glutathione S-transferase